MQRKNVEMDCSPQQSAGQSELTSQRAYSDSQKTILSDQQEEPQKDVPKSYSR